jgi:hypothetical protein
LGPVPPVGSHLRARPHARKRIPLPPLSAGASLVDNNAMDRPLFQMKIATMLGLVACVAFNFWLFRLGAFWGILGLNLTKHVAIAYLCQVLGVDRRQAEEARCVLRAPASQVPVS